MGQGWAFFLEGGRQDEMGGGGQGGRAGFLYLLAVQELCVVLWCVEGTDWL